MKDFTKIYQAKSLKPKNKGYVHQLLWMLWFDEKLYLEYIDWRNKFHQIWDYKLCISVNFDNHFSITPKPCHFPTFKWIEWVGKLMLGGVVLINIWWILLFPRYEKFFFKKKSFFCVIKWHTSSIDVNVMHTYHSKDKIFKLRNRIRYIILQNIGIGNQNEFFLLF